MKKTVLAAGIAGLVAASLVGCGNQGQHQETVMLMVILQ